MTTPMASINKIAIARNTATASGFGLHGRTKGSPGWCTGSIMGGSLARLTLQGMRQLAGAVDDGQDINLLGLYAVDNAIRVLQDFAHILLFIRLDDCPLHWKVRQPLHASQNAIYRPIRVTRRIFGDVVVNSSEMAACRGR
jgi:hypothetical protein